MQKVSLFKPWPLVDVFVNQTNLNRREVIELFLSL